MSWENKKNNRDFDAAIAVFVLKRIGRCFFGLVFEDGNIHENQFAMARSKITAIKTWMKGMGFKLIKSHVINGRSTKINYYSLGTFGIYEEISKGIKGGKKIAGDKLRFISWTPWGIDFEVNSVNDLSKAYQDSISYNPDVVLG